MIALLKKGPYFACSGSAPNAREQCLLDDDVFGVG
jgi:hypothetical protein